MTKIIDSLVDARMPTKFGTFQLYAFPGDDETKEDLALVMGKIEGRMLVRVHSECFTGDVLHSMRCDCGEQLDLAMERIAKEGKGIIVYSRQEGRGIGLVNKIRAYELQDKGLNTVEANEALGFAADERDYSYCKEILSSVGVSSVRLMTNNPAKIKGLEDVGIEVSERVSIEIEPNKHNENYLKIKAKLMGHMLENSN